MYQQKKSYNSNYNRNRPYNSGYNRDRNSRFNQPRDDEPRRNHQIRATEVLLIDENGENVGVVSIQVALTRAHETGLDLIEVSANAQPPVCKIINYSKYIYTQNKKRREGKVKGKMKELKEFWFTPVIEQNDIDFKVKRAKEFLKKGHNVRITMRRKGRQTEEIANAKFDEILTLFEGYSTIEPEKKKEGRQIFITLKPDGKTKNKQDSDQKDQEN
ncbi:MAG: translation initiation factor IF-3 [Candidatus Dojkabacteria bacterium]